MIMARGRGGEGDWSGAHPIPIIRAIEEVYQKLFALIIE